MRLDIKTLHFISYSAAVLIIEVIFKKPFVILKKHSEYVFTINVMGSGNECIYIPFPLAIHIPLFSFFHVQVVY